MLHACGCVHCPSLALSLSLCACVGECIELLLHFLHNFFFTAACICLFVCLISFTNMLEFYFFFLSLSLSLLLLQLCFFATSFVPFILAIIFAAAASVPAAIYRSSIDCAMLLTALSCILLGAM